MRTRRLSTAAAFLATALLLVGASTPVIPTAPIVDFRLPVFNEQGFRTWELRGSEAIYDPQTQIAEIKGLRLRVFSGDDRALVENTVESPLAIVNVNERSIRGPGLIHLVGAERGREFEIRGEDWTYQETLPTPANPQKVKTVVIRKAVVVTFSEDIGNILRRISSA